MSVCLEKKKPARDPAYVKFVRGHRCLMCHWVGPGVEAHHVFTGGMSTKCSDYDTVPLCGNWARGCHAKEDQRKNVPQRFINEIKRLNDEWRQLGYVFKENRDGLNSEVS